MRLDVRPRASDGIYKRVPSYHFRDLAKMVGGHKKPPMNGGAKERKGRAGAAFIERGFDEGAHSRQPKP